MSRNVKQNKKEIKEGDYFIISLGLFKVISIKPPRGEGEGNIINLKKINNEGVLYKNEILRTTQERLSEKLIKHLRLVK